MIESLQISLREANQREKIRRVDLDVIYKQTLMQNGLNTQDLYTVEFWDEVPKESGEFVKTKGLVRVREHYDKRNGHPGEIYASTIAQDPNTKQPSSSGSSNCCTLEAYIVRSNV